MVWSSMRGFKVYGVVLREAFGILVLSLAGVHCLEAAGHG